MYRSLALFGLFPTVSGPCTSSIATGPMGGGDGAWSFHDWPAFRSSVVPGSGQLQRNWALVVSVMSSAVHCRPPVRSPKITTVWNSPDDF